MEAKQMATVTVLPVRMPEAEAGDAENSRFSGDFGLAEIWRKFGGAVLPEKPADQGEAAETIQGLEMASRMADDLKKQEQMQE